MSLRVAPEEEPDRPKLESYPDDEGRLVVTERKNPQAWMATHDTMEDTDGF